MIISNEKLKIYIYVNNNNKVWGIELKNKCYVNLKYKPIGYTGYNITYVNNYMLKMLFFLLNILIRFKIISAYE